LQVRLPILFPYWRIAMLREGPIQPAYQRWIFPLALLAVTASLFAGTVLLVRDYFRQSRLSQLRTAFVGNVSHELKTPLAVIRLNAERLRYKQDSTSPDERTLYNVISWETERLKHMVDTVLEVSRIDRGQRHYHFTFDDLVGTISRIVETYQGYCELKGFQVQVEVQSDIPPVWHDPEAISEAIVNLLENAIKFSDAIRRINLRLYAEATSVVFQVRDYGIGIPKTERERIFQEFYRGSNAADRGGCGIGLYLVRIIMAAHHGSVEVEGQPDEGSTFRINFPICPRC
jgi:two-component system phosphate regulon sensor histidine kinase PhoR